MNKSNLFALNLTIVLLLVASACSPLTTLSNTAVPVPKSTEGEGSSVINTPISATASSSFPMLTSDLQEQLYKYLKDNRGCELPCLLGITPGKTSWADAKSFLETYSVNKPIEVDKAASSQDYKVYYAQIQTSKEISLMLRIRLAVDKNDIVQHINFDATSSRGGSYVGDDQHLSRYSLRELFLKHGAPDAVYMKPIKRGIYSLHVVYDELKIVVGLTGQAKKDVDGKYRVCPNLGEGNPLSLSIALANSSDPIDAKKLLDYPFYESEISLKDAAELNLDAFYILVSSNESPACFEAK